MGQIDRSTDICGSERVSRKYGPRSDLFKNLKHNVKLILTCSNASPIRCRGGIGYACCFCKEQFPDAADLKQHSLEHYEFLDTFSNKFLSNILSKAEHSLCIKLDITSLNCTLCGISINSLDELFTHLEMEHDKVIFRDMKDYIVPFKLDEDPLNCCMCSKAFNSFKALLEHMNTHSTNFKCSICCATFINKSKLSTHELTHVISEFKCRYCPKVLDTKLKQMCHEHSIHANRHKVSKCGYCGEKFPSYHRKEEHMQEAHGVPMKKKEKGTCKICMREFMNKNALNAHMRRIHLLEKTHKCEFCDMEFFSLNDLKNHELVHTNVKAFECQLCSKTFKRKKALIIHLKLHERQKCAHCGLRFENKSTLHNHISLNHIDEN